MKQFNKENISTANSSVVARKEHPSRQSVPKPYKSTIKVGYHVIPHDRKEKQAHVKKFIPAPRSSDSLKPVLKKTNLHLQQYASGVFVNSEYITNEPSRMSHSRYSRKNVEQAQQKYQSSQGVQQELREQKGMSTNRSYSVNEHRPIHNASNAINSQIKGIIEYQYARQYRPSLLAQKCTSSQARERFIRYSQLHDVDFRKKVL